MAPPASIPNLDPIKWAEPDIQRLYRPSVESLFSWTSEGAVTPLLAAEPWETSRDRLVYTVRLRDGVRFHDGSPMTADAVVASFRAALDPGTASQWSPRLTAGLDTVESAGASTVTFRLKRPFSPFETLLGLIPIIPSSIAYRPQETYARALVGTGPFVLESWDEEGVLRYRSFDGQHGAGGAVESFEVWFGDSTVGAEAIAAGTSQLAVGIGPEWTEGSVRVADHSIVRYRALANLDPSRITSSPGLRREISMALDRQSLVADALRGHGRPMYSVLSPNTDHALDDSTLQSVAGEVAIQGERPATEGPLKVVAVDDPAVRAMAVGVQGALERLGLASSLDVVSGDKLAATLRLGDLSDFGDFDLLVAASFAQPLTGFAPDYAYFELRSGMVTNLTKVADPELDRLLEEAVAAPPEERAFRWGAVQRYDVTSSMVEIPIAEGRYAEAVTPTLGGYQPSPTGTLDSLSTV